MKSSSSATLRSSKKLGIPPTRQTSGGEGRGGGDEPFTAQFPPTTSVVEQTTREDDLLADLIEKLKHHAISVNVVTSKVKPVTFKPVRNILELKSMIAGLCQYIYTQLGSQQLEGTYQRVLKLELERLELVVCPEVDISLIYREARVGSRRADLIAQCGKDLVLFELKAVKSLSMDHRSQLKYYMHVFGVNHGFLINFPHDAGFPLVTDQEFDEEGLCGMNLVETRRASITSRVAKLEYPQVIYLCKA